MTTRPPSRGSGGAGAEFAKGVGGLLLIAATVYFVKWLFIKLLWIWGKMKLGFFTLGKFLVCLGALVVSSFIIASAYDVLLAPLIRRIKKDREKWDNMSRCRLPDIDTFRTGRSLRDGEVGKVDTWMATLLRNRYRELYGVFPERFTFRNNPSAFSEFKAGELPRALLASRVQIEQDLFSPLIAAYRAGNSQQNMKEDRA